jgi:AhpD family alkylhydroperoxidase
VRVALINRRPPIAGGASTKGGEPMKARLDIAKAAQAFPAGMQAMMTLEAAIRNSGLEESLIDLVKIRASQINGCSYCIHMHTRDARAHGEAEERLYLLDGWHESPLYSVRERAALAWTEAVTLVSQTHVPDDVYEAARLQLSEDELVKLTLAIATINAWNRIAISFRAVHPIEVQATMVR